MNWILVVLALLLVLFFFKNLKHHLVRKSITFAIALVVFFLALMFLSSYLDMGNFFSRDSLLAKTGAAVINTVSDNVDTSSVNDFFSSSLSSFNNVSSAVLPKKSDDNPFRRIN